MYNKKNIKKIISISLIIVFVLSYLYLKTSYTFPQNIMLIEGKEYIHNFNTPLNVGVTVDKQGLIKLNGDDISDNYRLNLRNPIKLESSELGKVNLKLKLFGKIPFRTVTVNVIPKTLVVPCGKTIGVKINTKGVLVVGTSKVTGIDGRDYKPFRDVDIKEGDVVFGANGKNVDSIKTFSNIITNSNGKTIKLKIKRNSKIKYVNIKPIKSIDTYKYKLGLWVRDSTSGIGTMTFYEPESKKFAALGHGIVDIDTGTLLSVNKGEILDSSIISIKKGRKGSPGELKGVFVSNANKGQIYSNTNFGIYGELTNSTDLSTSSPIPIALRNEVKEGPATILSNINGTSVESFDIYIQKIILQNYSNSKSMVIKVTDPKLIEMTGGIVQGMSGSPIIQNGKLVGAVTHVFVNDSTRGYGIFSELMLQSLNKLDKK